MSTPSAVDHTVQVTNEWLREMGEEDSYFGDRERAYACLRAVLQELRDRLTVDEAVQLGAQLPTLVRGAYYGSWNPHHQPTDIREPEAFYEAVRARIRADTDIDVERATRVVFRVLGSHVSEGEIDDVVHMLPKPLQELWH